MIERLKALLEIMESIEVHGKDNLYKMLACINTLDEFLKQSFKETES